MERVGKISPLNFLMQAEVQKIITLSKVGLAKEPAKRRETTNSDQNNYTKSNRIYKRVSQSSNQDPPQAKSSTVLRV